MFERPSELAREGDLASVSPVAVFRRATRAITVFALLFLVVTGAALAQGQLVSEQNIADAILGRQEFLPVELNSLDLNRDGVVDIADLTFFQFRNANIVPSVSFDGLSSKAFEGDQKTAVRLVFTKAFESPQTITYTVGGTATYGSKSQGGDYTISGYDPVANAGTVNVNAGDTEAYIPITIEDDAVFNEGIESIAFHLTGGSTQTYFLGAQQTHTFFIDDNDSVWVALFQFPDGSGTESLRLEITQEAGVFSGRILSDAGLIPRPIATDPNASGNDGWQAEFHVGTNALRIEIGPIPVDRSLSFFDTHRSRYYAMDIGPGLGEYLYTPTSVMSGSVKETLQAVSSRLGPVWQKRRFLGRESVGTVVLRRQASSAVIEEVPLTDAR